MRKIMICFLIFILVVGETACSRKTSNQLEKMDPAQEKDGNGVQDAVIQKEGQQTDSYFTENSTVGEVISDPAFEDFGRLLFPVDRQVPVNTTLSEVSTEKIYVWYSNIQPEKTVEIVNHLKARADAGEKMYFPIYSDEEIRADASKADTGLFYFGGNQGENFAIMNAGGGFMYVGAMHDSFPHALEVSKRGYNTFALVYRPDEPYEDLARAITYLYDNAKELGINTDGYSLWGGSAGARMAASAGVFCYWK